MLYHTHLLLGVIFYLAFGRFFSGGNELIFFLFVLLGSILPDIDERKSKITQWSGIIGKISSFFLKHRGLAHSVVFFAALSFLLHFFWSTYYAQGLFLGYLAHLLGDIVTPQGVQLFYPFLRWRLRGPIKSGGFMEHIIGVLLVFLLIYFFFL